MGNVLCKTKGERDAALLLLAIVRVQETNAQVRFMPTVLLGPKHLEPMENQIDYFFKGDISCLFHWAR